MDLDKFNLKKILKQDLDRYWEVHLGNALKKKIGFFKRLKFIVKRPILWKVIIFRLAQASRFNHWFFVFAIPIRLLNFISSIILGIQIPISTQIGGGFYLCHWGAIVISKKAVLGENVVLFHEVTIGHEKGKCPKIGNNVFIGPGAKIFGDITIGDNCRIGANAVVNKSFPANCTIAGIPAKIVKQNEESKLDLSVFVVNNEMRDVNE